MSIQGPDVFFRRVPDERRSRDEGQEVVETPSGPSREQVARWVRQERRRVFHDRIGWLTVMALAVGLQLSWHQSYLGESPFEFWTASAPGLMARAMILSFPLPVLLASLRPTDLDQTIRIPVRVGLIGYLALMVAQVALHRSELMTHASWITAYALGLLPIWIFAELGGYVRETIKKAEDRVIQQAMAAPSDRFTAER